MFNFTLNEIFYYTTVFVLYPVMLCFWYWPIFSFWNSSTYFPYTLETWYTNLSFIWFDKICSIYEVFLNFFVLVDKHHLSILYDKSIENTVLDNFIVLFPEFIFLSQKFFGSKKLIVLKRDRLLGTIIFLSIPYYLVASQNLIQSPFRLTFSVVINEYLRFTCTYSHDSTSFKNF